MVQNERILFIDDDAPVRTAFVRSLRAHGFEIDVAGGMEDALDLIQRSSYAVIASDYRMPKINGLELIEKMRDAQPDATYMLVSGECDLDLALQAVNEHSISYVIPKPWDSHELASVLRRSIEGHWERSGARALQRSMVDNTRSLENQKDRLQQALVDSESMMAELLLNTLDLSRDHETRAHCRRVAAYSRIIAEEMGLRGHVLTSIHQGALLHDIGKIGIPDAILQKQGPLDEDEWKVVRSHTEMGARLLENLETLRGAREVVLQHHERFDGTGYPNAMSGEQICIGARVFAVADALDALLTDRPYRKAQSVEVAVAEIARCTGTHFDPSVVQAFQRVVPERWVEVRLSFPDENSTGRTAAA